MQKSSNHIDCLDYIRAIAILAVFFYHSLGTAFGLSKLPWGPGLFRSFSVPPAFLAMLPLSLGCAGVAGFFVVSGFCIHLSFARQPAPDYVGFYIRRFFRIYPPYLVAALAFAFLVPMTRLDLHSHEGRLQLFSHLFLVNNLDGRTVYGLVPAFWSIASEAQLYAIYPLLLWLTRKLGWRGAMFFVALLEIGLRGWSDIYFTVHHAEASRWLLEMPFFYWFSWSIGAWIAEAWVRKQPLPLAQTPWALWLGLAVGADFVKPCKSFSFMFFSILTACAVSKLLTRAQMGRTRSEGFFLKQLRSVGVYSYSLYLWHQPFIKILMVWTVSLFPSAGIGSFGVFVIGSASAVVILPASALLYRLIERPSMKAGKRVLAWWRPVPAARELAPA